MISLTPHPINSMAERSLSTRSVTANPSSAEHSPRVPGHSAVSASSMWERVGKWLKKVFGEVTFETSLYRRGYLYTLCPICRSDVHDLGVMCSRQLCGDCSACGQRVLLDGWMNCPQGSAVANTHVVAPSSIKPTTEREWLRMRILRICEREDA